MSEGTTGRAEGEPAKKTWEEQWAALSPFARAAVGVTLAAHCTREADAMHDLGEWAGGGGLTRRESHCNEVTKAFRLLASAAAGLCAEADAECAALLGEPKDDGR